MLNALESERSFIERSNRMNFALAENKKQLDHNLGQDQKYLFDMAIRSTY